LEKNFSKSGVKWSKDGIKLSKMGASRQKYGKIVKEWTIFSQLI
jgi:hypothetical protein